jgi:hypothetical protein
MLQQRNITEKRGGAETSVEWVYIPLTELRTSDRSHPAYGVHWFGPPGSPPPAVGKPVHFFEMEGQTKEVTAICSRYFDIMGRLVRDFIALYSAV